MASIPVGQDPIQRFLKAQSTHENLGARQAVYERLGLNKPGFWVDLKQRTLAANQPAQDMPTAAQEPINFSDPYDSQSVNYTIDPPIKLNPVKTLKMPTIPGQGEAKYHRGTLQEVEKGSVWGQLRDRMRANPILGADGSDLSIAEKNYMDVNIVKQMNADPDKFLSQALIDYYNNRHLIDSAAFANHITNFEQIVGMATTIKKQNLRVIGRFIAPNEKQKQAAMQARNQQITQTGSKNLNVKYNSYYSPPLYLSPFG